MSVKRLIEKLNDEHSLSLAEYKSLVLKFTEEDAAFAALLAGRACKREYGDRVFVRGLIEISSFCRRDCFYCGLRKSNLLCERYRMNADEILACCDEGYALGFRTFVLQGGEDGSFTDDKMCKIISAVKQKYPDCAITLSLGERTAESYKRLFDAGADRYLLRHETADREHYKLLHPESMSFENRLRCLMELKKIGYQTGCGFMVGTPHQMSATIAKDLKLIEMFRPHMCGIGPFIPHHATPFADKARGSVELTLFLLSVVRLILPQILLPATTALGTADGRGRERGILAGANVIMPNLSPRQNLKKYELYDGKIYSGNENAHNLERLKRSMEQIGRTVVVDRGDSRVVTTV